MPHRRHAQIHTATRYALALLAFTFIVTSAVFYATHVGAAGGDVDPTFNTSVGANSPVFAVALQPDGKVLIGGDFTSVGGVMRNYYIARLNANGSVDATFDTSIGADNIVVAVAPQPDGKVIIGGYFTSVNGVTRNRIARLLDSSVTLAPAADTYVQGADAFRDTNFGTNTEMQIKRTLNPGAGRGRRGFLRFDTSSIAGNIANARLRISHASPIRHCHPRA